MENFFDLKTSASLVDQIKFDIFCKIVMRLFIVDVVEKDKSYIYNSKLENEQNHQFIRDNWDAMFMFYCHTEYNRKTKRLVLQILNAMINHLNETYHFKQPIQLIHVRQIKHAEYGSNHTTTVTHRELKFN